MRGYSIMSDEERQSILQQHSSFYNGYAVGNVPSNLTPLTVYDPAGDKEGINVNNRGEVNTYKNHLVNESTITEKKKDDKWIQGIDMKKGALTSYCNGKVTCDCVEKAMKDKKHKKQAQLYLNMNSDKCKSLQESKLKEIEADDMDVSSVKPADNFKSGGPEQFEKGGNEDGYQMDIQGIMDMFGGEMSPADWDVVFGDELDGKEMYRGEEPAYDFDSEGGNVDVYGESIIRESDEPLMDLVKRIMLSRKFDRLANEIEPMEFSDEFEFADNFISYLLDDYIDEEYYDDLFDLVKDEYGEIILSMYGDGGFEDDDDFMFMEGEGETCPSCSSPVEDCKCEGHDHKIEESMCNECGLRESMCECGMYEEIDDELHESFKKEKQKITEMFNRFKKFN